MLLKLTEKMKSMLPPKIYAAMYRIFLNFWPCVRGGGGSVIHISPDFHRVTVKLKFSWRTRNLVGTMYGGSIYASTDPMYMLMLMEILGSGYVVWDKGCTVRFRRPAKSTIYANFEITPAMLNEVRNAVAENGEHSFIWKVEFKDKNGTVYAELDKVLYVAAKSHYKEKQRKRNAAEKA